MAMTPRERVYRALEMRGPDRVPRDLWALPIAEIEQGADRMDRFRADWPIDFDEFAGGVRGTQVRGKPHVVGQYTDEWGCTFENIHAGVIGEVKRPLLADWSDLDKLREPTELLDFDVDAVNARCRASDRFVRSVCVARPFERCQFLRGSENVFMDIAEDSDEFRELLGRLHAYYCKEMQAWARTEVDGLFWMDDWGTQQSLLINPATWREVFKPLYAEYVRIAHDADKKAFMHSDGNIADILPDLLEIGVDAINCQLFCMDIEALGRRFKGQITFWGEIDRQHILPHGSEQDARAAVRRVADALGSADGGVIAQFELGAAARFQNAVAVYDEWSRYPDALGWGG